MNNKCNHNPNSDYTTLKLGLKQNMLFPPEFVFICEECNKFVKFTKKNGKYVRKYD